MSVRLILGDCREALKTLHDASIDSIITDPPYHLTNAGGGPHGKGANTPFGRARAGAQSGGFMGMKWDGGAVAFEPETWGACLRVLKPGGHLLAFGGTRTYHRLVCAIEDAGFEIRDQIGWAFGSGFPKSRNGSWGGTALKPAWEPIVMARKPLIGTVGENVAQHGTGALNIDGCRVPVDDDSYARNHSGDRGHAGTRTADARGATDIRTGGGSASPLGRWPANLIHDGSEEVVALFPRDAGAASPVTGAEPSAASVGRVTGARARAAGVFHADRGSAARFFYCAKASQEDRNAGLASENHHPTVKPVDLMRYLCRLVTPSGGTVLDPFMGSGSTGKAAELEGFNFIGVELSAEYVEIARRRIAHDTPLFKMTP